MSDSYGRMKRMQGYEVFHPFGFDAFGLPAENYAVKTGVHPCDSTVNNITTMEEQFKKMGTTYDWDYEIVTCYPEYYKWTQWLFLKLYENGLAYRTDAPVNWCTSCMTVLANEQVEDDKCERCGSEVIRKNMTQWFFKITEYADELLEGLEKLDWPEKTKKIQENWIGKTVNESGTEYRLRDWLVSRQRYWGTPVPMIHCDKCGLVPVPEKDLPVLLPYEADFMPGGKPPLASCPEFINTVCPECGCAAKRDTDTLDTFVCSSWYFLRFFDNKNDSKAFDKNRAGLIMPVDKYVGGVEHASMHLIYARFITKVLRDLGYLDFDEPFKSLVHQGIIFGSDGKKMSKRDGAVSPDDYIEKYGSDIFRLHLEFNFSYRDGGQWKDDGIKAADGFLDRVRRLVEKHISDTSSIDSHKEAENSHIEYLRNYTVKQVTEDIENFQFNTALARLMEFTNMLYKNSDELLIKDLLLMLAPLAPHFSEEMWEVMGYEFSIHNHSWPIYDESKLLKKTASIAVQVNGVLRDVISVPVHLDEEELKKVVLSNKKVSALVKDKDVRRIIIIKDRLVNVVC